MFLFGRRKKDGFVDFAVVTERAERNRAVRRKEREREERDKIQRVAQVAKHCIF